MWIDESTWERYDDILKAACVQFSAREVDPPELLFHYTSAESCFSIVQLPTIMPYESLRLWASCALGMNDASEIRYGVSLVYEIASQFVPNEELELSFARHWKHGEYALISSLESTCITCFCDKPDLLSQWRAYGKSGTGYCLGFRRDLLSSAGCVAGFELVAVAYEREQQIREIRRLFEEASVIREQHHPEPEWRLWRIAIEAAIGLSLGFKHSSFSEEREWRLISTRPRSLNFRSGRWGIVPYVEISLPRNCPAEIWQGPTLDHDLTGRTLEMYLVRTYGCNERGESAVRVRKSEIPLRKLDA